MTILIIKCPSCGRENRCDASKGTGVFRCGSCNQVVHSTGQPSAQDISSTSNTGKSTGLEFSCLMCGNNTSIGDSAIDENKTYTCEHCKAPLLIHQPQFSKEDGIKYEYPGWNNSQTVYSPAETTAQQASPNGCIICSRSDEPLAPLINGKKIHAKCYHQLEMSLNDIKQREHGLLSEERQLIQNEKSLARSMAKLRRRANPTFIGKIFRKPTDIEAAAKELEQLTRQSGIIKNEAETTQRNLLYLRQVELAEKQALLSGIQKNVRRFINVDQNNRRRATYFRTDSNSFWGSIKKNTFKEKGRRCEKCLSEKNVHVDHIIPLSIGGSNDLRNLQVLCKQCHEKKHGRKFPDVDKDFNNYGKNPKVISPRAKEIQKAIESKKDIVIKYVKEDGTITERQVTPYEVSRKWYGRILVEGYCHLRNDKRTFRISRIRNMRIL